MFSVFSEALRKRNYPSRQKAREMKQTKLILFFLQTCTKIISSLGQDKCMCNEDNSFGHYCGGGQRLYGDCNLAGLYHCSGGNVEARLVNECSFGCTENDAPGKDKCDEGCNCPTNAVAGSRYCGDDLSPAEGSAQCPSTTLYECNDDNNFYAREVQNCIESAVPGTGCVKKWEGKEGSAYCKGICYCKGGQNGEYCGNEVESKYGDHGCVPNGRYSCLQYRPANQIEVCSNGCKQSGSQTSCKTGTCKRRKQNTKNITLKQKANKISAIKRDEV